SGASGKRRPHNLSDKAAITGLPACAGNDEVSTFAMTSSAVPLSRHSSHFPRLVEEITMSAEPTQALARFAAELSYDDVPAAAPEHCKNLLLDARAGALAGPQGEETGQVAALAAALAQSEEASVIGGARLSLAGATLLNGYLVTAVTMCDVHRPTLT